MLSRVFRYIRKSCYIRLSFSSDVSTFINGIHFPFFMCFNLFHSKPLGPLLSAPSIIIFLIPLSLIRVKASLSTSINSNSVSSLCKLLCIKSSSSLLGCGCSLSSASSSLSLSLVLDPLMHCNNFSVLKHSISSFFLKFSNVIYLIFFLYLNLV